MRLYKCPKVTKYLLETEKIDDRHIWCYAQAKFKIKMNSEVVQLYGMVLVCVKHESFFIYSTEFNSTQMELTYSCKLSEMEEIVFKKHIFSTKLFFVKGEEKFELDMDDWNRFASLFQTSIES